MVQIADSILAGPLRRVTGALPAATCARWLQREKRDTGVHVFDLTSDHPTSGTVGPPA